MKKILLVSNSQGFLGRNNSLLDRAGYKVYTATSAEDALRIHRGQRVDLIVAMLDMPGMGGDKMCSLIRQDEELCKVSILLVCYEVPEDIEIASRCGANVLIAKPVHPVVLLQEVEKLLAIPKRVEHHTSVHGIVKSGIFSGILRNVSESGILCETDIYLHPHVLITNMSFVIGSREIITDGAVIRLESKSGDMYIYGIKFIGLSPEYREVITNYVVTRINET
jgi:CheY-like chemotaxis protein